MPKTANTKARNDRAHHRELTKVSKAVSLTVIPIFIIATFRQLVVHYFGNVTSLKQRASKLFTGNGFLGKEKRP